MSDTSDDDSAALQAPTASAGKPSNRRSANRTKKRHIEQALRQILKQGSAAEAGDAGAQPTPASQAAGSGGTGAQPTLADATLIFHCPGWWWRDCKGKPIRYVYRAMRTDHSDLIPVEEHLLPASKHTDEFRIDVVKACMTGSNIASPFLHASFSYWEARKFNVMGHCRRGENRNDQCIVRIDLWGLYQDWLQRANTPGAQPTDTKHEFWMIDLSELRATKKFFSKAPAHYGPYVEQHWGQFVGIRHANKEVLLCWRGRINLNFSPCWTTVSTLRYAPTWTSAKCRIGC